MKPTQSILILLSLFLIFSCDNSVEPPLCDEGLTDVDGFCTLVCDDGLTELNGECIQINNQCNGCNYIFESSDYFFNHEYDVKCVDPIISILDCNEKDIQFLEELITQNGLNDESSINDMNNDDGIFQPNELGTQVWSNGRLIKLQFWGYWTELDGSWTSTVFYYTMPIIPESISNLNHLNFFIS